MQSVKITDNGINLRVSVGTSLCAHLVMALLILLCWERSTHLYAYFFADSACYSYEHIIVLYLVLTTGCLHA